MIRLSIIGSGNVAQHLIQTFLENETVELVEVYARKSENLNGLVESDKIISNIDLLQNVDLYIVAVSDDAITIISDNLNFKNRLVVHTSGSIDIDVLNSKNRKGAFYPLQTFSKNKTVDFKIVPICIEAENDQDYDLLSKVALSISDKVFKISSSQRKSIHVAAVFVCNFVNHLYGIGDQICNENNIPFEILLPLIQETAQKITEISPNNAQTGPAKRNDLSTIKSHLDFLKDQNHKNIYSTLTQSILENGKKL